MPVGVTLKLRRGTAADWVSANPVLAAGEPGYETDTGILKIGDGATDYANLTAFSAGGGAPNAATYADVATLIANQGSQVADFFYFVTDASADTRIGSGGAYYGYKGTNFGDIVSDYNLVGPDGFDWNRGIRKLPKLGDIPTGTTVSAGLEEVYFGQIDSTSEITSIPPVEIGDTVLPRINGEVVAGDGEIQTITLLDDTLSDVGSVAFTPGAPIVTFSQLVNSAIVPTDGDTREYTVRANITYDAGASFEDVDSAPVVIDAVYPFLSGMGPAGLGTANIYASLTKTVEKKENQITTNTGTDQRIYFAYPVDYDDLIFARDENGQSLLNSIVPGSPSIIDVDSDSLTADWTKSYKVYQSVDNITLTGEHITEWFFETENIQSSDDVPEGETNLYLSNDEKAKLAGVPNPSEIGNMNTAIYDPNQDGSVAQSASRVLSAANNSGNTIPINTLVGATDFDVGAGTVNIRLADKDANILAQAMTFETIADGQTGKVIVNGGSFNVDTSGTQVGDTVYLDNLGNFVFVQPTSGLIQAVGVVFHVDPTVGVISVNLQNKTDIFTYSHDWLPFNRYDQDSTVVVFDGGGALLGQFRATQEHTASGDFATDLIAGEWELVAGDMVSAVYDPGEVEGDVFDMDNMNTGIVQVAMTQAERTKLQGLEPPTFKGVFADPRSLRIAFPTADEGNNADVVSTATLWIWSDLAPNALANGSVTLDTGGAGSVDSITVNGIEVMSAPVPFNTSLIQTATDVAANIQANASVPNYDASSGGTTTITITDSAAQGNVSFTILSTATTITTTDVDLDAGTIGGDWEDSLIASAGDMLKSVYDPTAVNADAFAMENMAEEVGTAGPEAKIFIQDERTKLAGIEPLATADQTALEIKTAYESNADTNAYTDADVIKLGGIEAGAEVNQTDAEIKTQYELNANTNAFEDADEAKLDGISAGAEVNPADTDALAEGVVNLYYTEGRVSANVSVAANTAKVSADGSVTTHNDVTNAGSGLIITAQERTDIYDIVSNHSDVAAGGNEGEILIRTSGVWTPADVSTISLGGGAFDVNVALGTSVPFVVIPATLGLFGDNNGVTITGGNTVGHGNTGRTYGCTVTATVTLNRGANNDVIGVAMMKDSVAIAGSESTITFGGAAGSPEMVATVSAYIDITDATTVALGYSTADAGIVVDDYHIVLSGFQLS